MLFQAPVPFLLPEGHRVARRDDHDVRVYLPQKSVRQGKGVPLVRRLQNVALQPGPHLRHRLLPRFLQVPRQQKTDRPIVQPHHHRGVPRIQGWAGVEDGEQKPLVQGQLQASLPPPDRLRGPGGRFPPAVAEGTGTVLVPGDQVVDRIPFHDRDQARQDVFGGPGEDDHVQVVVPEGHPAAQGGEEACRAGGATDQRLSPRGGTDEDGIPAGHVQKDHPQPAIGQGETGDHRHQEKERGHAQQETVADVPRQTHPEGARPGPNLRVQSSGEDADQAVEGPRPYRRHPTHVHPGVGDARCPPDDLYGVGQEEPGYPAQALSQGKPEHPRQGRQSAPDHHPRLGREDQEVGQKGDEGEATEVVEGHRQGSDLRGQGDQQSIGEEACGLLGLLFGDHAGQQTDRPALQSVCIEHQAQSGGETQLEAHVPEKQRVQEGHPDRGGGQGGGDVGGAAQMPAQQVEDAHKGGPDHRCRRPDQKGIEGDAGDGGPDGSPGPEPATEEPEKDTADNGDVEPADGDDVGGAGGGKGVADVLRDAPFHAQEDAGQEGGGGFVEDAADDFLSVPSEREEKRPVGVDRPLSHPNRLRPPDEGKDPLAGQVLAVGEVGELRRGFQEAGDLQPVAVGEGGVAGEVDQSGSLDGDGLLAGEGQLFSPQTQAGVGIPFVRRSGDCPFYQDRADVVVMGQGVRREAGEGPEQPSGPQYGDQEKDAGGADEGVVPPARPSDDGGQSEEQQGLPGGMDGFAQNDAHEPRNGQIDQRHPAPCR